MNVIMITTHIYFTALERTVKGGKNEDISIKVHVWDSPGLEKLRIMAFNKLSTIQGLFLVYDIKHLRVLVT